MKDESLQARAVEKQAQTELKKVAARPRQLIVRFRLPNRDPIEMINDQTGVIHDEGDVAIAEEEKGVVLITSKGRRVRPPKFHDA